tara:strand:+ start:1904 stop:2848 length:945 start_codon:yes stop_codon:yes gene_type:complete
MPDYKTLYNVYVSGRYGLIFDENLKLLNFPRNHYYYKNAYRPHVVEEVRSLENNPQSILLEPKEVKEDLLYMMDWYGVYPFGHIYDSIQYLFDYEKANLLNKTWLVGRYNSGHTHMLLENHWKTFGHTSHLMIDQNHCVFAKTLHVSNLETFPAQIDPQRLNWIKEKYKQRYGAQIKDFLFKEKLSDKKINLYLHRESKRGVKNFHKILPILRENNFIILNGTEEFFIHQALFSNPNLVLGPHGSLFRNSLFCDNENNSKYYEWCPDNRKDNSIKAQSLSSGIKDYKQIFVKGGQDYSIDIPEDQIKDIINNHG